MTHDFILLSQREMILRIRAGLPAVGEASGFVAEIFGLVEIFLIARDLIQLCQSHLYDGMAGGYLIWSSPSPKVLQTRSAFLIATSRSDRLPVAR